MLEIENVKSWTEGVPVEPMLSTSSASLRSYRCLAAMLASCRTSTSALAPRWVALSRRAGPLFRRRWGVGCGMLAAQISITASQLPNSVATICAQIERDVPAARRCAASPRMQDVISLRSSP